MRGGRAVRDGLEGGGGGWGCVMDEVDEEEEASLDAEVWKGLVWGIWNFAQAMSFGRLDFGAGCFVVGWYGRTSVV